GALGDGQRPRLSRQRRGGYGERQREPADDAGHGRRSCRLWEHGANAIVGSTVRVLIVEDDPELAGLLRDGLRAQRIDATLATTFAAGRDAAALTAYGVIILDVRLPGGSGFELCGELRRGGVTTPVLMLTALDAVDDRVRGLEVGADDYLTKPFAFRELLARLKALARRRTALAPARYRVADLEVDLGARQVRRGGRPITLSAKEFALLGLLGIGLFVAVRHQMSRQLDLSLEGATAAVMRAARIREAERAPQGAVVDAVEELHVPDRALYLFDDRGRPITPPRAEAWMQS